MEQYFKIVPQWQAHESKIYFYLIATYNELLNNRFDILNLLNCLLIFQLTMS